MTTLKTIKFSVEDLESVLSKYNSGLIRIALKELESLSYIERSEKIPGGKGRHVMSYVFPDNGYDHYMWELHQEKERMHIS